MFNTILNAVLLTGFLVSILYGIITMASGKNNSLIFKVTLISIVALFISRLFFMVLNYAGGDENTFSVGVLGQVAGYLFLVLASKTYFPFESKKHRFNIKASLIVLVPLECYGFCLVQSHSLSGIVCTFLYLGSTCLALYFAFNNVLAAKTDAGCKKLKIFSLCIVAIALGSSLENIIIYIDSQIVYIAVCIVLNALIVFSTVSLLPQLQKEEKRNDC